MGASKNDIRGWFLRGKIEGKTHLFVVCDTFDWDDFPEYVSPGQAPRTVYDSLHGKNMQTVMEVYDLSQEMEAQLNEDRAMNWGRAAAVPSTRELLVMMVTGIEGFSIEIFGLRLYRMERGTFAIAHDATQTQIECPDVSAAVDHFLRLRTEHKLGFDFESGNQRSKSAPPGEKQ